MSGGSIEIRDMVARRGSFSLRVDELHIEPHEIFAIVGETGAGKTVLLEAIAGAFPLEAGSILLDGKDIRCLPVQQRRLGIVYQDHALFPHMTVAENIGYGLRMARVPKAEAARRVEEMLDLFSIRHIADRYPGIISGGEGQRAALARALVMRPEILLLDEPFSALDPTTKKRMYETLRDVHGRFVAPWCSSRMTSMRRAAWVIARVSSWTARCRRCAPPTSCSRASSARR